MLGLARGLPATIPHHQAANSTVPYASTRPTWRRVARHGAPFGCGAGKHQPSELGRRQRLISRNLHMDIVSMQPKRCATEPRRDGRPAKHARSERPSDASSPRLRMPYASAQWQWTKFSEERAAEKLEHRLLGTHTPHIVQLRARLYGRRARRRGRRRCERTARSSHLCASKTAYRGISRHRGSFARVKPQNTSHDALVPNQPHVLVAATASQG